MKICSKCQENKDFSLFGLASREADGLQDWCKECFRSNYQKNRTKKLAVGKKYREANGDSIRAKLREIYNKKKEKYIAKASIWNKQNPERRLEISRKHNEKSYPQRHAYFAAHLPEARKRAKEWRLKNPHKHNANNAKRRASERRSLNIEKVKIASIYLKAKRENKQVDHIIPLKNRNVSGLHVPWNLQILTREENFKKHNRFDGTYENESWRSR